MTKSNITKHYERNMRSNKVECSTAAGTYCTTHDAKLSFCMIEFSISNIVSYKFHVDNN